MVVDSVPLALPVGEGVQEESKELEEGETVEEGREASTNADISQSLSENPETGQSELIGEDLVPEVTSSHGDEGVKREEASAEGEDDPVSSSSTAVQLQEVGELLKVRGCIFVVLGLVICCCLQNVEAKENEISSTLPTLEVSSHETPQEENQELAKDQFPDTSPKVPKATTQKPPPSPHLEQSPSPQRAPSPTPSTESESSSVAEGAARRPSPPPCSLRERVSETLAAVAA